jgi:hypothetical protein
MSRYQAPAFDPLQLVELGYDAETQTFWYQVFEGRELISFGPPGEDLRSLIDLVRATWGYVDWEAATDQAKKLHSEAAWAAHARSGDPSSRYLARVLR